MKFTFILEIPGLQNNNNNVQYKRTKEEVNRSRYSMQLDY